MNLGKPAFLTAESKFSSFFMIMLIALFGVIVLFFTVFNNNLHAYLISKALFLCFLCFTFVGLGRKFLLKSKSNGSGSPSHPALGTIGRWIVGLFCFVMAIVVGIAALVHVIDLILWAAGSLAEIEGLVEKKWFDGEGKWASDHYFIQVGENNHELVKNAEVEVGDYVKLKALPITDTVIEMEVVK
ncbi:hypothetical protein ACFQZE_05080 [Paenibacillus sp. GCM10027627]|uniref:hypothetical protein n=1 Tax=unclassified Paenibacillus TaxID=185978 RepID=UPI0036275DD8